MTNPIAQIRQVKDGDLLYDAIVYWCLGCDRTNEDGTHHGGLHMLPVNSTTKTPQWTWNGSLEAPTLEPSILTKGSWRGVDTICHSYMRNGAMEFLGDCTHHLAGQTVPLPPLPDWAIKEMTMAEPTSESTPDPTECQHHAYSQAPNGEATCSDCGNVWVIDLAMHDAWVAAGSPTTENGYPVGPEQTMGVVEPGEDDDVRARQQGPDWREVNNPPGPRHRQG